MLYFTHFLFLLRFFDRFLVVIRRFPVFKGDRAGGAARQAIAKAVAEVFAHQFGFAVHDIDGALMACRGAQAAAVTFFLVYVNDLPDHFHRLLDFSDTVYYNSP